MNSFLARGFLVMGALFFFAQAQANIVVTCNDGDCLAHGWQTVDQYSGDFSDVVCYKDDCSSSGWYTTYHDQLTTDVTCKDGGCFLAGWQAVDQRTSQPVADISCLASKEAGLFDQTGTLSEDPPPPPTEPTDCLSHGWLTTELGRGRYLTRCTGNDCRQIGWDVYLPGYRPQAIRCKSGGCFQAGWVVYQ